MRFKFKVALALLAGSLLPIASVSKIDLDRLTSFAQESTYAQTESSLTLKAKLVEGYLTNIRETAESRAVSRATAEALMAFSTSSALLRSGTPDAAAIGARHTYQVSNTPSLAGDTLADWTGRLDARAMMLQSLYVAENPNPIGEKHLLDKATDGSLYSDLHAEYHPELRGFLERYGLYDVFLIEPRQGAIIYSVFKEMDFGTSLLDGPYADSNFGRATQAMLAAGDAAETTVVDFAPYAPSYDAQASFILSPVRNDGELVGIFAIQLPLDFADAVLQSTTGSSTTTDAYLVGPDHLLRSTPRLGDGLGVGGSIEGPLEEAMHAQATGTFQGLNHLGHEVIASWQPLQVAGLDWQLVSEVGRDEAMALADATRTQAIQLALGISVAVLLLGVILARWLMAPVQRLGADLQAQADEAVTMLHETGQQARSASETMAAAAEETSRQTAEMQQGSQETSSDVTSVAGAVEELSAAIQQVVSGVQETSDLVGDASRQTEDATQHLTELEAAAKRITSVVELIDEIAKQTDLLSLNAAIEASRAGEAGQGFSVVATEIRKLADRTTQSTDEIAGEVRQVFAMVEKNAETVRSVSELMAKMHSQAQNISASAEQQGQATHDIAARMNKTADRVAMTDQSLGHVHQASGEVSRAADDVLGGVENVETAAFRMEQALHTFVTRVHTL